MSHYRHLTIFERESLWEMHLKGESLQNIAKALGRSVSTISRELKRNKKQDNYSPTNAQAKYKERRKKCVRKRLLASGTLRDTVVFLITNYQWSPEQISNRLRMENGKKIVSYNTIYRALECGCMEPKGKRKRNRQGRFPMLKHLRRKGWRGKKKKQRKNASFIHQTIEQRPKEANERTEIGHWEGDLVYSSCHKLYIVTLVDRLSRYLITGITKTKKPEEVAAVISGMLKDIPKDKLKSITLDRGPEFAHHFDVTKELEEAIFYFAHPHAPWERGTNENTNNLLRQYVPKRTYKVPFSEELLVSFTEKLNNRPRKCLDWKTPEEIFTNTLLHLT